MVCSVLLRRDLTIHTTCMLCYRKERLSSLYSDKHPIHQRSHRYNWIAYRCLALVGLFYCSMSTVLRIYGAVQTVVLAVQTVNCPSPHALRPIYRWCYHPPFTAECSSPQNASFFASLRWLTLQIGAAILGCTRNAAPRLITP